MEKDKLCMGTKFAFYQEKINGGYLLYLPNKISNLCYCKTQIPNRLNINKNLRYIYIYIYIYNLYLQ